MKLDPTQTLKLLDGVTPLKMDAEGKEEMTLGKIISTTRVSGGAFCRPLDPLVSRFYWRFYV